MVQYLNQFLIAVGRFLPAAQHDGVAGLEHQGGAIHRHIGPRLVDDTHHAQRHAHFADAQAVGAGPLRDSFTDRIRKTGHFTHARHHGRDAFRSEEQPVAHGARESGSIQVRLVGFSNACGIGSNGVGHRQQQGVLFRRRQLRHPGCRALRAQQLVASRAGSARG